MVGRGSHSRPQNLQASNKQSLILTKGKPVEVSSDDDGFKGAWYLATIVDSPPNVSKKRQKVAVQYKTLIKDDKSPLVESVDLAFVRPLPPDDFARVFQESDVVDASYRDGWWAGVVRKVLGGSRYRVYFDNPPDIMDFHAKNLRSHLDWVNETWVSSDKQQTTESIFSSGTDVEVNLAKENPRDVWFPAVVIKENEDGTFHVKCKNSGKIDEAGRKLTVDSCHIRPIPPRYVDRNYELLEKVDVPYSSGWRPGLITKLLSGKRYNVFFKQGNEDKEVNHSHIRPHAEWVDGRWICKSKGVLDVSDNEEPNDSTPNNVGKSKISLELKTNGAANGMTELKTPCSNSTNVKNLLEQSTERNEKSFSHELPPSKKVKLDAPTSAGSLSQPSKNLSEGPLPLVDIPIESPVETLPDTTNPRTYRKRSRKTSIGGNPGAAQTESPHDENITVASLADELIRIKELPENSMHQKSPVAHRQKLDSVTKRGRSSKSPLNSSQVAAKAKSTTHINESEDKMKPATPLVIALQVPKKKVLKDLADIEGNIQTPGGSSQRRKRGRPRKLKMASGTGKDDSKQEVADQSVVGEKAIIELDEPIQKVVESTVSQVASKERATEVSEQDCETNKIDLTIPDMEDENRPLSMWIEGMHSSANAEDSQLPSGKPEKWKRDVDQDLTPGANKTSVPGTPEENHCLPFVKKSMVWKTIESMEVFQLAPQKPHFQPLADSKEEYREGSAIGVMVTFAALFEKITSLKFDDPKNVLESTLESLVDLEKHGFDVKIPRERVVQLVSIKDSVEKLQCETKDTETQIKEISNERKMLAENAKDIEKKIAELEKELLAAKSKLESRDSEIAKLQIVVDSVNVKMNENRVEFEKVASSPWKLL